MITVTSIEQTCTACPSQWSLRTDDGRYVYVRYRGGWFRVEIAASEGAWWQGEHETLYQAQLGDPLDGFMTTDEMKVALVGVATFEGC